MKNIYKKIFLFLITITPNLVFGDTTDLTCNYLKDNKSTLQNVFDQINCIVGRALIPMFFTLALAMFTYGVINFYFLSGDDEAKRNKGKQFMIWGIIALTVMVTVWGLVGMLGSTLGLPTDKIPSTSTLN